MKSKEYLKTKLNEISNIFPELSFRYQFNENTKTHIIEVKPLEASQTNDDYIKYESNLMFDFENMFLSETILFVSEDSLTQITNPEFVFDKKTFKTVSWLSNYKFDMDVQKLFSVSGENNYALAA